MLPILAYYHGETGLRASNSSSRACLRLAVLRVEVEPKPPPG